MKDFTGYIIPTKEGCYVGFILSINNSVYWNSHCTTIKDLKKIFKTNYPNVIIKKPIEKRKGILIHWAEKISSILVSGIDQDTSNIPLDLSDYTPKQQKVIEVCHQQIPINTVVSYAQVADMADLPNAFRFVGTTMKKCRQWPIIPCHRVKNSQYIKRFQKKTRFSTPI